MELDVGEALGPLQLAILDDPNALNAACTEELLDGLLARVVRQVSDVGGEGGAGGERRGGKAARLEA